MKKKELKEKLKKIKQRLDRIEQAIKSNADETWCDFTDEQWKYICKHNYLVQIKQGNNWSSPSPLSEYNFNIDFDGGLKAQECRLYKAPGIAQPWFGGDCPVDYNTKVLVKLEDGEIVSDRYAGELDWDVNNCRRTIADRHIIEYVYLES